MLTDNSISISSNLEISEALFASLDKEDPKVKKIGFDLLSLQQEYQFNLNQSNEVPFQSSNEILPIVNGNEVVIDAVAVDDPEGLLADLQSLGMKNASVFGSIVSGSLPIESIDDLAIVDSLKFAQPAAAITNVGSTTSQAIAAMNADIARSSFSVDGSGVTVGVLSDSYDNLGGESADIASGDLPGVGNPLGNTTPVTVLEDLPANGTDEGRAMLQLIHDVAPGADLAFHTAFGGQANFANGINDLATVAGSDVIVDDIIYFAEPMFQDGIIAQAVDNVVADGVSYFSSAGNNARDAYESAFNPSGLVSNQFGEFHDFDPGAGVDIFQSITVPVNTRFNISFQWDSPFFSVSGGAGSPNDLDIFLINSAQTTILTGSASPNIGNDPVEIFSFFNDGSFGTDQFNIAISKSSGANPSLMKYVMFESGNITTNEFDTSSGTVYGHANANGAEAVGAAFYQDTPRFGTDPAILESFSSPGPTPILFETDGTPTLEVRQKPEIVAPDGTNTTFFGQDVEPDGLPNFFGTSAAAPHAAAVAALMLEAAPGTSPADIYAALENTALDMDDPSTPGFDNGVDNATGYGLIQADLAIEQVALPLVKVNDTPITNQVESYGGNQDRSNTGNVTVSPSNQLNITGNRWQKVEINSTITPNTVLSFTFEGSNGEIQGIGFDNNNVVANDDRARLFQVAGSQSWGIQNLSQYIVDQTADGKDIYSIPVGQFFTGDFDFLTFANDDDQANPDAQAQFRDIELFEPAPILLDISIDGVNQDKEILSYGGANQNKGISSTVSNNGTELTLVGNGWRKVDITGYEITDNTRLEFEFKAQNLGEIQGIGFDNNDVIGNDDAARFFQVAGTQNWGIDNLADYTDGLADADGFIEYSISVGDFFKGEFDFLTFGNDHDVANPTATGEFRNIQLIA